jgi:very-short-patch-repair endonuclease
MNFDVRLKIREEYSRANLRPINGVPISPYSLRLPWMSLMSPIEDLVWGAIRFLGLPLYPQYPIGPYFADFADPERKLVIEVDSIRWHKDLEKDARRDADMRKLGWMVVRIPSRMVYKNREDFTDENGNVDWDEYSNECAEGLLWFMYQDRPKRMAAFTLTAAGMMSVAMGEINDVPPEL